MERSQVWKKNHVISCPRWRFLTTRNDAICWLKSVSFCVIPTVSVLDQSPDLGIKWHEMTRFPSDQKACHFVASQQIVFITRNDTIFFSNKKRGILRYFYKLLADFASAWVNFGFLGLDFQHLRIIFGLLEVHIFRPFGAHKLHLAIDFGYPRVNLWT